MIAAVGEMVERTVDFRVVLAGVEISSKNPRGRAIKRRFGSAKEANLNLDSHAN